MDIAVNLVESYLRLNGYLTLSEFEVQRRNEDGTYETVTDVDIVGLRFPGGGNASSDDCWMLQTSDDALQLRTGMIDVILGEVKEGEARFNPSITRHEVLHSVLQRLEWVYGVPIGEVVDDLARGSISEVPACQGPGRIRTRLVAFGRSATNDLHTLSLTHVFETVVSHLKGLEDALRPAQYRDPATALLNLLVKTGFSVEKGR